MSNTKTGLTIYNNINAKYEKQMGHASVVSYETFAAFRTPDEVKNVLASWPVTLTKEDEKLLWKAWAYGGYSRIVPSSVSCCCVIL
jgi:hypothetical protein